MAGAGAAARGGGREEPKLFQKLQCSVGEYLATVRLHGDLVATIKLKVVSQK
jgi:ribosomal protein L9